MFKNNIHPLKVIGSFIASLSLIILGFLFRSFSYSLERVLLNLATISIPLIIGLLVYFKFKFIRYTILVGIYFLSIMQTIIVVSFIFDNYYFNHGLSNLQDISMIAFIAFILYAFAASGFLLFTNTAIKKSFNINKRLKIDLFQNKFSIQTVLGGLLLVAGLSGLFISLTEDTSYSILNQKLVLVSSIGILISYSICGFSLLLRYSTQKRIIPIGLNLNFLFLILILASCIRHIHYQLYSELGIILSLMIFNLVILLLLNNQFLAEKHDIDFKRPKEFEDILDSE